MKKIVIVLAMSLMAQTSFAFEQTGQLSAIASAEIFFTTALGSMTSEITTISTLGQQKLEAQRLQRDVQEYQLNGSVSLFLASKIEIVHSLDSALSVDESVDFLIEVSEVILAK